jgi:hypothetical protein
MPWEIDLVRGLRYIYPLCLFIIYWALAELGSAIKPGLKKLVPALGIAGLAGLFLISVRISAGSFGAIPSRIISRMSLSPYSNQKETIEALEAIRTLTPPGASIFSFTPQMRVDMSIRYNALHPLAFCSKDGGAIGYTDPAQFISWAKLWDRYSEISGISDPEQRFESALSLARDVKADYILLDSSIPGYNNEVEVVYKNDSFLLLKLK